MWQIEVVYVKEWLMSLDRGTYQSVFGAFELLALHGPALGRPLVDTVYGSQNRNMKELRPPSPGRSEIRILFAFDPQRQAVLLVGGDKRNEWRNWYDKNIPRADRLWEEHLISIQDGK